MNYAQLLFPDFSLILIGYLLCRFTQLNRSVWEKIDALVYFFLFPVLLFHSVVKSPLDLMAASNLIGAAWTLGLCGIAMAYSLKRWPVFSSHIDPRLHAGSAQVGFRFNSFIALAMVSKVVGPEGLLHMAVIIGVCVPLFNVAAVWPMARHGQQGLWRELSRNPLIIATASGLLANVLGFSLPVWLEPTVSRIGQSALALGLMAAGAGMQLGSLALGKLLGVQLLAIKHLGMPLMAFGLARLFGLSDSQSTALLVFSAVPTASSCYVLAARMGYNGPYVAGLVTLSVLLGVLSLPFALGVLGGV